MDTHSNKEHANLQCQKVLEVALGGGLWTVPLKARLLKNAPKEITKKKVLVGHQEQTTG
jgi:hypothetical protein